DVLRLCVEFDVTAARADAVEVAVRAVVKGALPLVLFTRDRRESARADAADDRLKRGLESQVLVGVPGVGYSREAGAAADEPVERRRLGGPGSGEVNGKLKLGAALEWVLIEALHAVIATSLVVDYPS